MISLRDLRLKVSYDSDTDDFLNDFYIPVLSNSKIYYRMAAYFSSKVLALAARGMNNFIRNGGEMKLLCGATFSDEDYQKIVEADENPEKIIEESFIKELDDLDDEFFISHLSALGWMLAEGKLEIKIAIPVEGKGIFHPKIGILFDESGDAISFSGSDNETAAAWSNFINIEEFKVFKSWTNQKEFFDTDLTRFNKYWKGLTNRTWVIDIPEVIKEKLIKLAPKDIDTFVIDEKLPSISDSPGVKYKLRPYQEEAIDSWVNNGYKGIFKMATGTGKTVTALSCFKKVFSQDNNLLTVIACPQTHLVDQWYKDVIEFYGGKIIKCFSSNSKWKKELKDFRKNSLLKIVDNNIVLLTTHKTLASDFFMEQVQKFKGKKFIIVDEVHGIGSENQSFGLAEFYDYRLGLSATPERYSDEEGTSKILEYFGGIVYTFDMKDALNKYNPDTGKSYLTHYYYYPIFIDLNREEYGKYKELTHKMVIQYNNKLKNKPNNYDYLVFERRKIINNASNKFPALENILRENKDINHLIIFTSDKKQVKKIQKILTNEGVYPHHKFTSEEAQDERNEILKKFDNGIYKSLVAIKCLDEGVDVPSAEYAIIMSSTLNPKEYVQRRGRLLRNYSGKKYAKIYDLLVFPEDDSAIGKTIMENELQRYKEFARDADNSRECLKLIQNKRRVL